jgi:hypothetical protein
MGSPTHRDARLPYLASFLDYLFLRIWIIKASSSGNASLKLGHLAWFNTFFRPSRAILPISVYGLIAPFVVNKSTGDLRVPETNRSHL